MPLPGGLVPRLMFRPDAVAKRAEEQGFRRRRAKPHRRQQLGNCYSSNKGDAEAGLGADQ